MKCVFCDEKIKNQIIDENESCIALLSRIALVPGHCLIIPKRHVEKLEELTRKEQEDLFSLLLKIQKKLLKKYSGVDIRQHYRPFMKQGKLKVDHIHFHLQPREMEDELYQRCQKYETEIYKELDEKEIEKLKKELGVGKSAG